jgi:hypothetical protein
LLQVESSRTLLKIAAKEPARQDLPSGAYTLNVLFSESAEPDFHCVPHLLRFLAFGFAQRKRIEGKLTRPNMLSKFRFVFVAHGNVSIRLWMAPGEM